MRSKVIQGGENKEDVMDIRDLAKPTFRASRRN